MPLDAFTLHGLCLELDGELTGARIDKVQMPERDAVVLSLRTRNGSRKLLLNAGGGSARVSFTTARYENPDQPPMFCMLLRKYLVGARIEKVEQPDFERMLDLTLDTTDPMGVSVQRHLIAEMMGSYSNLILTDSDGLITECLRRIDSSMSEKRMLLPGLLYRLPPKPDKISFPDVTEEDVRKLLRGFSGRADKALTAAIGGISPLLAREMVYSLSGSADTLAEEIDSAGLYGAIAELQKRAERGEYGPTMLTEPDGKPADYCGIPVFQYENARKTESFPDFSGLLQTFYERRDRAESMRRRSAELVRTVKTAHERTLRRLASQREELRKASGREQVRENADILMANLHLLKKGMTEAVLEDFYAGDGSLRKIRLDPTRNPKENAAALYKEYNKKKTAEQMLTTLIRNGEQEEAYLGSVLEELSRAEGEADLTEIRAELVSAGYLREKKGKKEKHTGGRPMRFLSDTGREFYAGRSNTQNDELTMKLAFKNDLWFHVQKLHGSHVIVPCRGGEEVDETTVRQAAAVAAYYSEGRQSGNVPVDYTRVRFVKKPSGAKPGMVIYTDQRTLYVDPSEELTKRLSR